MGRGDLKLRVCEITNILIAMGYGISVVYFKEPDMPVEIGIPLEMVMMACFGYIFWYIKSRIAELSIGEKIDRIIMAVASALLVIYLPLHIIGAV